MVTLEKIRGDLLAARKARDENAVGLLNPLLGEAARIGKDAGNRESTPTEVQGVVKKFLDNARDTRAILAAQPQPSGAGLTAVESPLTRLNREILILEGYMPQQMSEDDLRTQLKVFQERNPEAKMGEYMAFLKSNFPGRYDGKQASGLVKEILG